MVAQEQLVLLLMLLAGCRGGANAILDPGWVIPSRWSSSSAATLI